MTPLLAFRLFTDRVCPRPFQKAVAAPRNFVHGRTTGGSIVAITAVVDYRLLAVAELVFFLDHRSLIPSGFLDNCGTMGVIFADRPSQSRSGRTEFDANLVSECGRESRTEK